MTQFSRFVKSAWVILMVLAIGYFSSCSSDDNDPTPAPIASFQFAADETNGLEITFTNYSKDGSSYAWNFGDGAGTSTETNVTYSYAAGGTYTVTLTATNEAGTSEHTKEITVVNTLLPVADFNYIVNGDNPLEVTFSDLSVNANAWVWDFGDNAGTSSEANPSYAYAIAGTYTVMLTVSNQYGSVEKSKEVTVVSPDAVNMIANGGFDDTSVWNIIPHNASGNGYLVIADGVANFDEAIDVPSGSWGEEAHMGLNQMVSVEAGNYQFDMDITTTGIDECWFEVWVGTQAPVAEVEYNEDNNATKVLAFNSWDCAETVVYSGPMAAASCQDLDGSITLDAGDYYIVIRSGGFTFGEGGIVIDNVSMFNVD